MHVTPKVFITALLIAAIPVTVSIALLQQNLTENAAAPDIRCGGPGNGNNNTCPEGFMCKLLNPSNSQAGGFCVPAPSVVSSPPQSTHPYMLSCADCQANGKNTLCFNSAEKTASCRNTPEQTTIPQQVSELNTLCVRCSVQPSGQPAPTGFCLPRPPCLDATPRCMIAEPRDGWCPLTPTPMVSKIPTPTIPLGCKPLPCTIACPITNPNCCAARYVCPSGTPKVSVSQGQ
jgi:hypothetical protein